MYPLHRPFKKGIVLKNIACFVLALFLLFFLNSWAFNAGDGDALGNGERTKDTHYYSDYYVFIAEEEPLVIPLDFNWNPSQEGYKREFKAWYGTKKQWPIAYVNEQVSSGTLPKEAWEHKNNGQFKFNKAKRSIELNISFAPKLTVSIPEQSKWIPMPNQDNNKEIFAFQTTAYKKGRAIKGWMIYERIRWDADFVKTFGDFKAFYWVPLIIDGDLYHFEFHNGYGKQTATQWSVSNGKVVAESAEDFELHILTTEKDAKSGRKDIPRGIQLKAPKWNLDISLESKGAQVGYGEAFPKGLAYYRQSMLVTTKNSKTKGYGMLELILEND